MKQRPQLMCHLDDIVGKQLHIDANRSWKEIWRGAEWQ